MENSINEERIKRFGEITILDIDNVIEGGNIRMCNENDFIDNIVVTIDEIVSIYNLLGVHHHIFLDTLYNKFCYKDGYIEIQGPFTDLIFTKEDFEMFGSYVKKLNNGGI